MLTGEYLDVQIDKFGGFQVKAAQSQEDINKNTNIRNGLYMQGLPETLKAL